MKNWDYENEQWTRLPAHLKHLPLFSRHKDWTSYVIRALWAVFLWIFFKTWVRLKVVGSFKEVYKSHPRLLIISNHTSHLDANVIAAAIPFRYWLDLYFTAAKDYFFTNPLFTFFSAHCIGAIPIDRKDRTGEAISLCINLLSKLDRIWLVLFPEGTRSMTGMLQTFKKGISVFSTRTNTPILFLYIQGNAELWPKGRIFTKMGAVTLYVGPVHPPAPIAAIDKAYRAWVKTIDPSVLPESSLPPEATKKEDAQDPM